MVCALGVYRAAAFKVTLNLMIEGDSLTAQWLNVLLKTYSEFVGLFYSMLNLLYKLFY